MDVKKDVKTGKKWSSCWTEPPTSSREPAAAGTMTADESVTSDQSWNHWEYSPDRSAD